jgi:uncharacterized membrane protein YeaQ/YmgE (transglycosylase-associated protein family)
VNISIAALPECKEPRFAKVPHQLHGDAASGRNYVRIMDVDPGHIGTGRRTMDDTGVGWIAAIIIGGFAGWLAEMFMKSDTGLLMNIVLGIVGAAIASALFSILGIHLGGWIGYLIAGFIGACLLIWIVRMIRGQRAAV